MKKHLGNIVRVVVAVVLLWVVLRQIKFHDQVEGVDGQSSRYVNHTSDTVTIQQADGSQVDRPITEFQRDLHGNLKVRIGLTRAVKQSDKRFLLLYLLVFAPVPFIQSLRFQWLLRGQEIFITYWESVRLCFAGNLLNFTMIGTTGGDVFKAYYVAKHTDRKTEAVTTILLDRIIGLTGLVLMVGIVVLPFAYDRLPPTILYFVLIFVASAIVGGLLFLSPPVRKLLQNPNLIAKLPLGHQLSRIEQTTRRLLHHKVLFFSAVGMTVMIHFLVTSAVICAAMALRMRFVDGQWVDYYAYIAGGNLIAAVPVSFMGLGTMEWFYQQYFTDAHGSPEQIILLALSVRIVQLFWALPGALVAFTGAYRRTPHLAGTDEIIAEETAAAPVSVADN